MPAELQDCRSYLKEVLGLRDFHSQNAPHWCVFKFLISSLYLVLCNYLLGHMLCRATSTLSGGMLFSSPQPYALLSCKEHFSLAAHISKHYSSLPLVLCTRICSCGHMLRWATICSAGQRAPLLHRVACLCSASTTCCFSGWGGI